MTMFNKHTVEIDWGGRPLKLETGKIARQADGAVVATYGESVVLATVVAAKTPREGVDFLPLTVDYQEKTYAAGRIPGGFFKREGRPSEKEILTCRLIDRPVRPLFPEGFYNEVQIIATVMEQRCKGTMQVWAEPFTRLRLPKIYNLRTDPYEFADVTSNSYYEWMIYHAYILYGAYALADKFAETFKDFPIIQKPNTFTIDDAIAMMKTTSAGS